MQSAEFRMQNCGVRVSGGHLCEAEALFEPAGETRRPLQNPIGFII